MYYVYTNEEETAIVESDGGYKDDPKWKLLGTHKGDIPPCARWSKSKKQLVDCETTKSKKKKQIDSDPEILLDRIEALESIVQQLTADMAKLQENKK